MRTFKIPFSYTVNGEIEIEGVNLGNAINRFNRMANTNSNTGDHVPVLDKATKLTPDLETIEVDEELAAEINPAIKWIVSVTRTQTVDVEVEAHDEDEAERLAHEKVDEGDFNEHFMDEDVEITNIKSVDDDE
jgi:hypothetical protein